MPDGEVAALADMGDGPAVAVLNPVGGGESRSRRSLLRVMITSPTLARFPSARRTSCRGWVHRRDDDRGHERLSSATSSRVGASMIASSPAARSETQAAKASSVVVARSPT